MIINDMQILKLMEVLEEYKRTILESYRTSKSETDHNLILILQALKNEIINQQSIELRETQ